MARRKRYSAEFKRQALRRANQPGVTDALVCEELGVSARQRFLCKTQFATIDRHPAILRAAYAPIYAL